MTEKDLYVLAGSAGVIAFMLALAALLGLKGGARIKDSETVRRVIADYEPDASVSDIAIGANAKSAVARLADGRLAFVAVVADGYSARVVKEGGAALSRKGEVLRARFADLGFPAVKLRFATWPDWLTIAQQ